MTESLLGSRTSSELPMRKPVRGWLQHGAKAFAVVCGAVSGGLVVLDFDVVGTCSRWADAVGDLARSLDIEAAIVSIVGSIRPRVIVDYMRLTMNVYTDP